VVKVDGGVGIVSAVFIHSGCWMIRSQRLLKMTSGELESRKRTFSNLLRTQTTGVWTGPTFNKVHTSTVKLRDEWNVYTSREQLPVVDNVQSNKGVGIF
jgi:hypothetical protein